jgi:hypothetical protein
MQGNSDVLRGGLIVTSFEISVKISPMAKALGKETISMELSEWELFAILKAMSKWNKKLYIRMKKELIEEAKKDGYDMSIGERTMTTVKCRHCGGDVKV